MKEGVDCCSIHGGKGLFQQRQVIVEQDERTFAIDAFKNSRTDVLIATDIASKGLDFLGIQHVINYDMPKEIEDYGESFNFEMLIEVHRIGRTGRKGNKGIATTFVNRSSTQLILGDLKALLMEAGQRVPRFLEDVEVGGVNGGITFYWFGYLRVCILWWTRTSCCKCYSF